jgi:formate dehydrogenase iron-sulfur subunit
MPISRRDFLKGLGIGGAAVTAACLWDGRVHASIGSAHESWGVLIDLTRCTGCGSCALACKQSNDLPYPTRVAQTLDSDAYTCLESCEVAGAEREIYVKRQCMNCIHPACASACTVGALRKTPEGPVVYDAEKCIGCRYCQYACPFGVPTYEWEDTFGLISKCQFCYTRLSEGQAPACASACPNGALRFGKREALLAQAHAQIASNPGRYVDHVYGEHEAGGTAMLYLSPVPFDELGFPALDSEPIPHQAETVMKNTPIVAVTVASVMTGLNWALKRRDERMADAADADSDIAPTTEVEEEK